MKSVFIYNANGIHSLYYNALKDMGFKVSAFIDQDFEAEMQLSLPEKILNTVKKIAGKKTDFNQLWEGKAEKYKEKRINQIASAKFDIAFVISPQNTEREFLQKILPKATKKIAYHWDGINRFEGMTKNDDLFDRVYVFDPADSDGEKYFPATNCYFDDPETDYPKSTEVYYNTFFSEKKIETLSEILKILPENGNEISVRIFNKDEADFTQKKLGNSVKIETETQDYRQILDHTKKAKVLLDIKAEEHNGLSFRFFEAICYRSKVITNNASVKDYDFYHPENIFVWTEKSTRNYLENFLNMPYREISEEIRLKYYFPNWFRNLANF